jgi:hypothetical protein
MAEEGEDVASENDDDGLPTIKSHRRLLEVMSIVSAAYYWFDIRINTQSNLMGIPVHIGSTRYALATLWIGLLWAAWRYGQQVYQSWSDSSRTIAKDYSKELSRVGRNVVLRHISRLSLDERRTLAPESAVARIKERVFVHRWDRGQKFFDNAGKEVPNPNIPRGPLGNDSYSVLDAEIEWWVGDGGTGGEFRLGIGRARSLWIHIKATVSAVIRRPGTLNYVTPVFLFLFAALSLTFATVHRFFPVCLLTA